MSAPLARTVESSFDQAFANLFRERFPMLYRYLSRISGDPALADDVAQESFLRLHARGSMPDDPSAWLISVANNIVRDEYRTTRRRERLLTRWLAGEDHSEGAPATDAGLLTGERQATVRRALGGLRLRDQRLLILRHEGFSYKEIAEALGIAPASVGTLLVRATAALSKIYREQTHASD
jgi:RNA polymerase sigma-70 factor (ECF subfamily)